MDTNYTHITMVVDRSGSMLPLQNDTIGGFNRFLAEQKEAPGRATLSLVTFSYAHDIKSTADFVDIKSVPPLTKASYSPEGGTALLDAMGRAIVSTGIALHNMPEAKRPARVLFVVITDGEENASIEYDLGRVRAMVREQTARYSWDFVFMGANIDTFSTAGGLGIAQANAVAYAATPRGVQANYAGLSRGLRDYRGGGQSVEVVISSVQEAATEAIRGDKEPDGAA